VTASSTKARISGLESDQAAGWQVGDRYDDQAGAEAAGRVGEVGLADVNGDVWVQAAIVVGEPDDARIGAVGKGSDGETGRGGT
jgi:hypothetical protein